MLQDHFVKARLPKVEEEIECMGYCMYQALVKSKKGQIDEAKAYMDNALRSLEVLRQEVEYKHWADKAIGMFKQMDPADVWRVLHDR
jgi:hypothetical protein